MNKSFNKNTKKEKDLNLDKEIEDNPEIDFSNFLQNYIANDSGSENSLISDNEDEDEDETNKHNLENFCYSSDSSSDYLPAYSTLTLRSHNYIQPIYVGPIDIEVYRVIHNCLIKKFPEEICELITDFLSSSVFV